MIEKEITKSFSDKAKDVARRIFRNENAVLAAILVVLIAIFAVMTRGVILLQEMCWVF